MVAFGDTCGHLIRIAPQDQETTAMKPARSGLTERIDHHKEGTIRAKGQVDGGGVLAGYWEWFRKDGTKLRSGWFDRGNQVGSNAVNRSLRTAGFSRPAVDSPSEGAG